MNLLKTLLVYLTFVIASGAYAGQTYFVDDDGVQCPGAIATIQEAVAKARNGDTILVCPGTYLKTVTASGDFTQNEQDRMSKTEGGKL